MSAVFFVCPRAVQAQNPDLMTPEQNTAKARALIQEIIQALGGDAYLNVKDVSRSGRAAYFDSKGALGGYSKFWDFARMPDKFRIEYGDKRNVIDVYSGDDAWTLDRSGVHEKPAPTPRAFQLGLKKDMNRLLRFRLNEEGMIFRYAGSQIIDLKRVDLVEIVDKDKITTIIALVQSSKLPLRVHYIVRDYERRTREEDVELFANYSNIQGVQTPMQRTRFRNENAVFQIFYDSVRYNTGLHDNFFTKEALDQAWNKLGKK
jgi:hypothetical protein